MTSDAAKVRDATASNGLDVDGQKVPRGYKRTEVGIIPCDWGVQRLSKLLAFGPKNGYSGRTGKDSEGTPTLSLGATTSGRMVLNDETVKALEETIEPGSELFLMPGDVLVQRSNTTDLVGTTAVYSGPPGIYVYPDLMMRMRFRDSTTAQWFWRFANSTEGRRYFVSIAAGSSGSMPKISGARLRSMPIPFPSATEQRTIADTLSDVDGLLGALEALIAKKRAIKQAAMQQLLTGKTRLPGFSGEWETKRLGELGRFLKGSGVKRDDAQSGPLACVRYGELYTVHHDWVRTFHTWVSPEVAATATRLEFGDLLFAGSGETKEEIGKTVAIVTNAEAYAGGDIVILRPSNVVPLFFGYALNMPGVIRQKASLGQGDAVVHISATALAQVSLAVPSIDEQTAIAIVLADMDAEIAALEARRDKTRAIKQGMIQQLLTGRVRLVKPEAAA
jgi:type I restriction enzyme S subunit